MASFIKLKDVKLMTGLSRSSIYAMMKDDKFPHTVLLGVRAVAWVDIEVNEWMQNKLASRSSS